MQGKHLSSESFEQLGQLNLLLRPFQRALQEIEVLAKRTGKTPGVLDEQDVLTACAALKQAMRPALERVNDILREHYGFALGQRISVSFRHSNHKAQVYPVSITVFSADKDQDRHIQVNGLQVLKSGAIGIKEYSFQLQGPNLDIEVLPEPS